MKVYVSVDPGNPDGDEARTIFYVWSKGHCYVGRTRREAIWNYRFKRLKRMWESICHRLFGK